MRETGKKRKKSNERERERALKRICENEAGRQ